MNRTDLATERMAKILEGDATEARAQLARIGVSGPKIWDIMSEHSRFISEVSYLPDYDLSSGTVVCLVRNVRAVVIDWPYISFIEINNKFGSSEDPSFRYFRNNGLPYRVISFAVDWIDGVFLSSISDVKLLEKVSRAAACRVTKKETTIHKSMKTTTIPQVNGMVMLQFGRGYNRLGNDPRKTELRWSSSGSVEISSSFMLDRDGNGVYSRVFNFLNLSSIKVEGKQLPLPF